MLHSFTIGREADLNLKLMKKRFLLLVAIAVGMLQTKAQTMFEAAHADEVAQMDVSLEMGEELPPDGYD